MINWTSPVYKLYRNGLIEATKLGNIDQMTIDTEVREMIYNNNTIIYEDFHKDLK